MNKDDRRSHRDRKANIWLKSQKPFRLNGIGGFAMLSINGHCNTHKSERTRHKRMAFRVFKDNIAYAHSIILFNLYLPWRRYIV